MKKFLSFLWSFIVPLLLAFLCFKGITYTDDFEGYAMTYERERSGDVAYAMLEYLGVYLNLDFESFYAIPIFIQLLLYAVVFRLYKVNAFVSFFAVILLNYVAMANQLRYFIAFPLFLISVYYWCFERKKKIALAIAILSVLFHSGTIALIIYFPLYEYIYRKQLTSRRILSIYALLGIIVLLFFSAFGQFMFKVDEKYAHYTNSEGASLLGVLFIVLYGSLCLFFLYIVFPKDKGIWMKRFEYPFLFSLSFFPVIFIIATFSRFQIIASRYVDTFFVVWMITLLFLQKERQLKKPKLIIATYITLAFIVCYLLPIYVFGYSESSGLYKALLIWESKGGYLSHF